MGKNVFPKVARISYTPNTLAAAIAKNVRLDRDEPLKDMSHEQNSWGQVGMDKLLDEANKFDISIDSTDTWDNSVYTNKYVGVACPTTACIAGYAGVLSGDVMIVDADRYDYALKQVNDWGVDPNEIAPIPASKFYIPKEDKVMIIEDRARSLLGVDHDEANFLFNGERTTDEVLEMLDAISSGGSVAKSAVYRHAVDGHMQSKWVEGYYTLDDDGNDDEWVSGEYADPEPQDDCIHCVEMIKQRDMRKWLNAEKDYYTAIERWLQREFNTQVQWLAAEQQYKFRQAYRELNLGW